MTTDQLETFVLLSRIKNFTQTAEQLFIAQSTVTNRITELEKEINYPLFIRQKNNLSLTPEGQIFLSYAQRLLELEHNAIKEIHGKRKYTKTIQIGTTNTLYECYLEKMLTDNVLTHPDIQFKVTIDHSMRLIELLQDKIIDVAYTFIPYEKHEVKCKAFHSDELILVSKTPHPAGIKLAQLPTLDYLYCDFPFQSLGSYIRDLFPPHYPFRLEVDQSKQLIPYLEAGIGCSFLPRTLIQNKLDTKMLYEIALLDFQIPHAESFELTL